MISKCKPILHTLEELHDEVEEEYLARLYLGIDRVPCKICSPLRADNNPSLSIQEIDGKIYCHDFADNSWMSLFTVLSKMWGISFAETVDKIYREFATKHKHNYCKPKHKRKPSANETQISVVVRDWMKHDAEYWGKFGVTTKILDWAYVKPISHIIFDKNGNRYTSAADRHAYVYAEFKGGKTTIKIYQPYNKCGFKWLSKHDNSVVSLWSKLPKHGTQVCICSSLKDALCLWVNTGIPCCALQGEAYGISATAANELKRRFDKVYVLFDSDEPGIKDAAILCGQTGFINIELPYMDGNDDVPVVKDVAEMYQVVNDPALFTEIMLGLFQENH